VKSNLYWEQWIIAVSMVILLLLGAGWGLPNQKTIALLESGQRLSEQQLELLTKLRTEFHKNRDESERTLARSVLAGTGPKLEKWKKADFGPVLSEGDRLADFRSFVLSSAGMDEGKAYATLSRMNPSKLDFDPKGFFLYGGAYVYPLGAFLYTLKLLGLFHATQDISFYIAHPEHISRMYMVGRVVALLSFFGILLLLGRLGNKLRDRLSGTIAMLCFSVSTLALDQSLVSKPHLYATFWGLLSTCLALEYLDRGSKWLLVLCGLSAGWALGSAHTAGVLGALLACLLLDRGDLWGSFRRILLVWALMVAVFLLTNPYVVITFDMYWLTLKSHGTSDNFGWAVPGLGKLAVSADALFRQGFPFPLVLLGLLGMLEACFRGNRLLQRLALASVCQFLVLGMAVGIPRMLLPLAPAVCLYTGYGASRLSHYLPAFTGRLRMAILAASFLPGVFFAGLSMRDYIWHDAWHSPAKKWAETARIDQNTTIGVFTRPHPTVVPPFPFVHARVVNLNPYVPQELKPDWVVIGNGVDKSERPSWESHPFRQEYELAFNLGVRDSHNWFRDWRYPCDATLSGWVFKRRIHAQDG
jgi:hypothetical protein